MSNRSLLAPVLINGTAVAGVFHNRSGPGRDLVRRQLDGQFHITKQSARKRWASAEIKTVDIVSALARLTGSTDLPAVAMDGTNGYLGYYGLLKANYPEFAAGSVHETRKAISGAMWCESIEWSEGGDAELGIKGLFDSSDGTVEPLVYGAASLPSIPATGKMFDLTSATLNGSTQVDVASLSIRFDPRFSLKRHPGSTLARGVFNDGNAVDIGISMQLGDLSALRAAGAAGGTGSTVFVFTDRAQNGGLGTSTLTITVNGKWVLPGDESAAVGGDASGQVEILPSYDGTNKPVTWLAA
jgi:hypothetical protein